MRGHPPGFELAAGAVRFTITDGQVTGLEQAGVGNAERRAGRHGGDGIYTAVAHGAGTTVDLVGLQAQITAQIDALL